MKIRGGVEKHKQKNSLLLEINEVYPFKLLKASEKCSTGVY